MQLFQMNIFQFFCIKFIFGPNLTINLSIIKITQKIE